MKRPKSSGTLLVLILLALGSFAYGFLLSEAKLPPYSRLRRLVDWSRNQPRVRVVHDFLRGRHRDPAERITGAWQHIPDRDRERDAGEHAAERKTELQSIGYLSGYEPSKGLQGVTVYMPDLAYKGYNLITSGHAQEARLLDMEGNILHSWSFEFGKAFPEHKDIDGRFLLKPFYRDYWRRAYLYENGDLLAIYEGLGLIKLDRDSRLLWKVEAGCHHDVFVDHDGLIYVLGRELRMLPQFDPHGEVLDDFMAVVDTAGRVLRKISLVEAFENSSFAPLLSRRQPFPDMLHTNTVQVLDGSHAHRSDLFREGNVLISPRNIDAVAILDPQEEKVVWALTGLWKAQHEPALLPNGNMLVFDNLGHGGMSKVIEIEPFTQTIVWIYEGTTDNGFFTEECGAAHRLPNGNTLIIESAAGRAFEVTQGNRIAWEYYNPERAGEDETLIATVFDVVRLPGDFPLDWIDGAEATASGSASSR